jgi:hypothetical protein
MFELIDPPVIEVAIPGTQLKLQCQALEDRATTQVLLECTTDAQALCRMVTGWNVKRAGAAPDDDGLPVSPVMMARVLDQLGPDSVKVIVQAIKAARDEAKRGN